MFNVGDAVRVKGQKGRPIKWIVSEILAEGVYKLTMFSNPTTPSRLEHIETLATYTEIKKKEKNDVPF